MKKNYQQFCQNYNKQFGKLFEGNYRLNEGYTATGVKAAINGLVTSLQMAGQTIQQLITQNPNANPQQIQDQLEQIDKIDPEVAQWIMKNLGQGQSVSEVPPPPPENDIYGLQGTSQPSVPPPPAQGQNPYGV